MKGYTIIEMIIVVAILGIMAAVFTTILSESNHAFFFLSRQSQFLQESRVALNWMVQELTDELLIGGYHSFDITNRPDAAYLKFTRNSDALAVIYTVSANTLTRQLGAGTARTLASNVTSFTYTYLDTNRNSLAVPVTTANLPNIVSIRITMTLQVGNDSTTFTTEIAPRNAEIPTTWSGT